MRSLWENGMLDHGIKSMKDGGTTSIGGTTYTLMNFKPSDVDVEGIIMTLARYPRYVGHTNKVMSVAQHSARGFMAALLNYTGSNDDYVTSLASSMVWHDGSEAYTGDISKPLKRLMANDFTPLEHAIEKVISDVVDVPFPYTGGYKIIDNNMALDEMMTMIKNNKFFDYWNAERAVAELTYCWSWISSVTDMEVSYTQDMKGLPINVSNSSLYYLIDSLILIGRIDLAIRIGDEIVGAIKDVISVDQSKHEGVSMGDITSILDEDIRPGVNLLLFFLQDRKHTIGSNNFEHTYIDAASERINFYKNLRY